MKKLNKRKIRWIIKEVGKREVGVYTIAKLQHITPQWARKLPKKYVGVKDPVLLKAGRKPELHGKEEVELVCNAFKKYGVGAVILEKIIHMPHNKIHKILKSKGLAKNDPMKQRRRKWIRYERRHSLSLVHSDWFEYKDWKMILVEDDASRFITGYGKFRHATSQNTVKVIKQSLRWGKPKQFHSDHGSVYTSNDGPGKKKGEGEVEKYLKNIKVQQIFAKVKHPQSNGKLERLVGTIKTLWKHTGTFEKAIKLYNYTRPHMSLTTNEERLRTPYQAFKEKKRKE